MNSYKIRAREMGAFVIMKSQGPGYNHGGFDPGYVDVNQFAKDLIIFNEEEVGQKLLSLVPELRKGVNSSEYTHNEDGTVDICFELNGKKYEFKGDWV